ncbi:hypothetical protein ACS0TY_012273 [Phlomoides rotata]
MEIIQQIPFNITTVTLISTFIFFIIKAIIKPKSPKNLPPIPPALPVIGHLHHFVGGLVHEGLAKLSKTYGPIVSLNLGQVPAVAISSREAAKEVLKVLDPACADRPESIALNTMFYNNTDIAFSAYNDYWRQMRKICILEMLSAKNVKSFGYIRQDETNTLVKSLKSVSGKAINLTEKMFVFSCTVTCRATFGDVLRDRDAFIVLVKKLSHMAGGFELADLFPSIKFLTAFTYNRFQLRKMKRDMDVILDHILAEHRLKRSGEGGSEDIVDVLLRVQESGQLQFPITNDNVKAVILDMFADGTESSATTIDWGMAELMRNPRVMAKVQSEIRETLKGKTTVEESDVQRLKYLKLVIKETLRLHPAFPLLLRQAKDEFKVDGYTIPVKTKVTINVWAMARDPKYWEDAESFKPERFENSSINFLGSDYEFLPFGAGRRNCPGLSFGIANLELPLAQLLFHFDWKLPQGMSPQDVDMAAVEGLAVGRKIPMVLIPTIHNPSNREFMSI